MARNKRRKSYAEHSLSSVLDVIYPNDVFERLKDVKQRSSRRPATFWPWVATLIETQLNVRCGDSQNAADVGAQMDGSSSRPSGHYLSEEESGRVCDALFTRVFGAHVFRKMLHWKFRMGFSTEAEFITWILDLVTSVEFNKHAAPVSEPPAVPVAMCEESAAASDARVTPSTSHEIELVELEGEGEGEGEDIRIENVLTDGDADEDDGEVATLACHQRGVESGLGEGEGECATVREYRYDQDSDAFLTEHVKVPTRECPQQAANGPHRCGYCHAHTATEADVKKHIKRRHAKPLQHACSICGKRFVHRSRMLTHLNSVHLKKFTVKCEVCGRMLCSQRMLEKHKQTHSTDRQRHFKCNLCSKTFFGQSALDNHFVSVHEDRKNFVCEDCGKTFAFRGPFHEHSKQHRKDRKRFLCIYCPKSFVGNNYLLRHVAHVHAGAKIFVCDVCGKSFSCQGVLNNHKLIHYNSRHPCDLCDKRFSHKKSLRVHRQIVHCGSSKYACEVCGKACYDRSDLDNHRRTHTREKPFVCEYCQASFTQKSALNHHVRCHLAVLEAVISTGVEGLSE